ncbi:MAG: hypothetical protein JNK23_04560 [Opitutaceae bacterium]|nr:hypothetical protein [Opitutaceae bacterium]
MELRTLALIALTVSAPLSHASVRAYPLDERIVYTVRIGREAPTTCVFPGALTALEGAAVATKPDDNAAVLLSHQPGTDYFSVRALRETATGALNVVFRGHVFALSFTTDGAPDRVVRFLDEPFAGANPAAKPQASDRFAALVARAKHAAQLAVNESALASTLARAQPGTVTAYPLFTVTVADVFRFEAEDALVVRLRFANESTTAAAYDPAQLAIRVGTTIHPAVWCDGSGAVPPRGHSEVFAVIGGTPGGGRTNLGVGERFSVIAPRP